MKPRAVLPNDPHLAHTLGLIQAAFASMTARIDPPSSIHRLTMADLQLYAQNGALWVIGAPPVAAVIAKPHPDALYIGKLAVAETHRGQGAARALITEMARQARNLGKTKLRLETRIELVENHITFAALGFVKTSETAHPGYTRATAITMERTV